MIAKFVDKNENILEIEKKDNAFEFFIYKEGEQEMGQLFSIGPEELTQLVKFINIYNMNQ